MRKLLLTLTGTAALVLMSLAPAATAAGNGYGYGSGASAGGGGSGGEEVTEVGNNLSVAAEFVPSSTTQGAPALNVACSASPQAPRGPMAGGYWEVAADGGVFAFGNATYYGGLGATKLAQPVVGMAAAPGGTGYWLVARDGGVFAFGSAGFAGSTGNVKLAQPIVGMASDPATGGYWLVASDGGVFSFNAPFYGSTGDVKLAQPIVGMTASPTGKGYRLVAADGGVFTFGDAGFFGAASGVPSNRPIVAMDDSVSGQGYEMVATDGGVFNFGDSVFYGSLGGTQLAQPIVGVAHYPGYWLQGTTATWSAYCADVPAATVNVTAQWGSNLKDSTALHAGSPIRVEVSLLDMAATGSPWQGYNVTNLTPNLDDRYATYGTDGTTFLSDGVNLANQTRVWTTGTTLTITAAGSATPLVETPMAAEINSGGAIVYGFNWGGGSTGTSTPAGTYTLTFGLSGSAVNITGVVPGSAVTPTSTATSTSITVVVK